MYQISALCNSEKGPPFFSSDVTLCKIVSQQAARKYSVKEEAKEEDFSVP